VDLLDALPDPALLVHERRVLRANPAAHAFFGAELVGQRIEDVLPLAAVRALDQERPPLETCRHMDGDNRLVAWSCVHLEDRCLLLACDVTGRVPEGAEDRIARLEALNRLSLAVASGADIQACAAMAFDALGELEGITRGGLSRLDGDALQGLFTWSQGVGRADERRWPLAATPGSACLDRKGPVQVRTSGAQAVRWRQLTALARSGVKAVLYVPLDPADPRGVLSLGSTRMSGFSPPTVEAVQALAEPLAVALRRAAR
jgi:hypothetical protein